MHWLLVGLAAVSCSMRAAAEPAPKASAPSTFEYASPSEKNYLRAFLELEALTSLSVVWYVIDVRQGRDVGYRWQIFERKLSGTALAHDDNAFGTNFRGHGLGGNAYYLSARSNRLSIAESFGYALAGATLWEYFGEVSEVVSANDLIVTPFTGIGVGEPFTQLGAYFDRRAPSLGNRILGAAFAPIKTVNDALDGAKLRRNSDLRHDFHQFWFAASPTFTRGTLATPRRSSANRGDVRLELGERLARLPDYADAGEHAEWFSDGNVSGIGLSVALSERGLDDFAFGSSVVPFGYYARHARHGTNGPTGAGLVVGFELGYRYLVHRYLDGASDLLDRAAFVRPAGLMFELSGSLGQATITSRLDLLSAYGGVHPLASRSFAGDRAALPAVLRHFDYYFGAGGELEASLALAFSRLEADASLLGRRFVCVDEHAHLPISDSWERYEAGFAYRILPQWSFRLFAESGVRSGRLGAARARAVESTSGLQLRAGF